MAVVLLIGSDANDKGQVPRPAAQKWENRVKIYSGPTLDMYFTTTTYLLCY